MSRFAGRVALVTGGGNGIGAVTAQLLAHQGAAVGVFDINADDTAAVVKQIQADGGRAVGVAVDVSDEAQWPDAVATVERELGPITLLHSNAAVTAPASLGVGLPISELPVELWSKVLAVNTTGGLLACKYTVPGMQKAGGGSIVFTSSVLGLVGKPDSLAYTASKGAIQALTRGIAASYGASGIRANAVAPGPVNTQAVATIDPELMKSLVRNIMLGRFSDPENIADAVAFLLSEEAAMITGQVLVVDGGLTAKYPTAEVD